MNASQWNIEPDDINWTCMTKADVSRVKNKMNASELKLMLGSLL